MFLTVLVTLYSILCSASAQEIASDCPAENGYFADAVQCDKYYECKGGALTEKLCPDGMVFSDVNPLIENCDFPFQVKCDDRPELQPPQPTENCPRRYGYFPDKDSKICNRFYYCADGRGNEINCPEGLVFSLKTGTCVFPDQAGRTNCESEALLNFTCPQEPLSIRVSHPRYADPNDCQYFYVCINGKDPRRNGCGFGEVFNSETKACDRPINVPECKDYYKQYFEEYFANIGGAGASPNIIAAALASGFDVPNVPKRFKIDRNSQKIRKNENKKSPIEDDSEIPNPQSPVRKIKEETAKPNAQPPRTVPSRRKPANLRRPIRRRRPGSRTTTTTTTTSTTEAAPEYYYDYYYDEIASATKVDSSSTQ